jgi:hypothetical protein
VYALFGATFIFLRAPFLISFLFMHTNTSTNTMITNTNIIINIIIIRVGVSCTLPFLVLAACSPPLFGTAPTGATAAMVAVMVAVVVVEMGQKRWSLGDREDREAATVIATVTADPFSTPTTTTTTTRPAF